MAAALRIAGVNAGDAAYLVATAHPESSGCDVIQQGEPYATTGWGVWQITPGNSEPQYGVNNSLLNLDANARAAAAKLRSQGLGAWTTITSGKYLPYLPAAKIAVSNVYGMPLSQVNALAAAKGTGNASTTGFSPLGSLGSGLTSDLLGGLASSLGLPSSKDMMIRFGLIILGGLLLIVGVFMLVGKQAITTAVEVAAPESRVALAAQPSTARAREARARAEAPSRTRAREARTAEIEARTGRKSNT